jgi:hypothetical protein
MATALRDVRSQGQSGKQLLALSFSGFDPERSLGEPLGSDQNSGFSGVLGYVPKISCEYRSELNALDF